MDIKQTVKDLLATARNSFIMGYLMVDFLLNVVFRVVLCVPSAGRQCSAFSPNDVPRQVEHLVHGFEGFARSLWEEEPHPYQTEQGDSSEEEECALGLHGGIK